MPHALARREVEVRLTASTVEVFHHGQRVASHMRCHLRGSHTTVVEHMPKAHRAHLEWTPGRYLTWAAESGPNTRDLVRHLLFRKPHPEQGYRSCLGLLSLSRRYGSGCARPRGGTSGSGHTSRKRPRAASAHDRS